MINKFVSSYTFSESGRLYLLHDDLIVVFEGSELIRSMERDLKSEEVSEDLKSLIHSLEKSDSFLFLRGSVTVNRTDDLLDEYQLEAYAKYPTSSNPCYGGGFTSGPTMADDSACLTYSIDP